MTKTYTGFEALERMKTHWIQKEKIPFNIYRFEDGKIKAKSILNGEYINTTININLFFNNTFVDYVEPLVAGDTVKVELMTGTLYGEIGQVFDEWGKTWFRFKGNKAPYSVDVAVRIEKSELDLLKREATFKAAGRRVDEFHSGDVIQVKSGVRTGITTVINAGGSRLEIPNTDAIQPGAYGGSSYVQASEVKPIKFVTYVDATTPDYVKVDPVAPCTAPPMPGMGQPIMNTKEMF
ncbi:hypothetical protein Z3_16 [Bacillus phage Z3]|nr:hypothetical protein Z3_16 [Bacillus phage Z3]